MTVKSMWLLGFCLASAGCGSYLKEYAPVNVGSVQLRIPNQQRLVAQSTQQAVARASAELKLNKYAGRTARVEVNGVFPHSEKDFLDYLATAVEGEASAAGIKVLARPAPVLQKKDGTGAVLYSVAPPDIRIVASVDWGGIDLKDERSTRTWPLAGQIGLAALGVLGPVTGIAIAQDDEATPPLLGVMVATLVGAGAWAIFHSSEAHTFTMIGRVRVTLRAIPVGDGLVAAVGVGEAENSIVIDPESTSGFTLSVSVPKEK